LGVGLYLSNEIVKRHRGRMWFESKEEQGSTFSFSLPLDR
jgi:signal transduction histidine kinase